jgi:hypothetical protein
MKMGFLTTAVLFSFLSLALPAQAKGVHVRGHTTKSGQYVSPHMRTSPDFRRLNNWSTKGNINPYTGKAGTKPISRQ